MPCLTDAMRSGGRLKVILRVKVTVHEDDGVRRHQVKALTPCRDETILYTYTVSRVTNTVSKVTYMVCK